MAEYTGKQPVADRAEQLPGWVIEHMIKLSEFAAFSGLSAFEGKLIDATEVLLQELIDKGVAPAKVVTDHPRDGNVIPFAAVTHSANPDAKARRGTGCN